MTAARPGSGCGSPLDESSSWALHRAVYADGAVTATG